MSRTVAMGLIVGITIAVAAMTSFAYRATSEWRRASELLAQQRAEQTADLLLSAVIRDMHAAEHSVLRRLHWAQLALDEPFELNGVVASAFALYPYPEVFFAWHREAEDTATFFIRAERPPAWLPADTGPRLYPVTPIHGRVTQEFLQPFMTSARHGRHYAAFEIERKGEPYQVVTRLLYRTERRDELEGAVGFLVNLRWARQMYFPELLNQMMLVVGAGEGLKAALLDENGTVVAGQVDRTQGPRTARDVRPVFFDPLLVTEADSQRLIPSTWHIEVSAAGDPSLIFAMRAARRALPVTTAAVFALGLGLILTGRAIRASADLAQVRSDFVSSVTHELKTPLATIRGVGEALLGGRLSSAKETQEYAQILDQEAKRLVRLVDNLLAYSRVTEASEIYSFESLAPADLIEDALRGFESQFAHHGFEAHIDIPADLPPVRADRATIILALENLVDNALRYGGDVRCIVVRAWQSGGMVVIAVADRGVGIPAEEIDQVVQRFVRGRRTSSGGTGLGLAIVNRVVKDHSGSLNILSRVGEGTEVQFSLPVASG